MTRSWPNSSAKLLAKAVPCRKWSSRRCACCSVHNESGKASPPCRSSQRRRIGRCCRPRCAIPSHGRSLALAVDTNVLVYAADADSQFHDRCRGWLERQRSRADAWYTTWGILYEFLRKRPPSSPATTVKRVVRVGVRSGAPRFSRARRPYPNSPPCRRRKRVIRKLPHLAGNLLHDAPTAILMREHKSVRFARGTRISISFISGNHRSSSGLVPAGPPAGRNDRFSNPLGIERLVRTDRDEK